MIIQKTRETTPVNQAIKGTSEYCPRECVFPNPGQKPRRRRFKTHQNTYDLSLSRPANSPLSASVTQPAQISLKRSQNILYEAVDSMEDAARIASLSNALGFAQWDVEKYLLFDNLVSDFY